MFAVPGWSISTSDLKPQKDPVSNTEKPVPSSINAMNIGSEPSSQSTKRKRGHGQEKNGDKITKSNLHEMYRRHIEGRSISSGNNKYIEGKKNKKNKKDKKNRTGHETDGELKKDDPTEEDRESKAKKQKNHASQAPTMNELKGSKNDSTTSTEVLPSPLLPPATGMTPTPLQKKMRDKLLGARFRHLNETLYTTPSNQAFEMFSANPELFAEYHTGFSRQVKESWPSNPVDGYIQVIRKRGTASSASKKHPKADAMHSFSTLPRRPNGLCTIADLGCGDAQLARTLAPSAKKLQLKLLSYDLQAPNPLITKADISALPLENGNVDVAIFCLSLMGTNWISFVEEAWRVLRSDSKGECWVSEVKSRFGKVVRKKAQIGLTKAESNTQRKKNKKSKAGDASDVEDEEAEIFAEDTRPGNANNDETDISLFVEVFRSRGFILKQESVDKSNKMFVQMEFVKQGSPPTKGKYAGIGAKAVQHAKKRFIDKDSDDRNTLTPEEEAKVLKPCVYKTR